MQDQYFLYLGAHAMMVRGPITGRAYRFYHGMEVAVDARDAPSVAGAPHLRRTR
jgi:hypothetical protein